MMTGLLLGSSGCDHDDWAIVLDHLVVIIRVMTPGIWGIDLDHLVVSMETGLLTCII